MTENQTSDLKPCPFGCGANPGFLAEGSSLVLHPGGRYEETLKPDGLVCALSGIITTLDRWNRRASGWLSVEGRPPVDGERVLFYFPEDGIRVGIRHEGDFDLLGAPTLWQPLPDPPEAE